MINPEKGVLLIANPFLKDPNFLRTVVLICNYTEEGAFGLILNKRIPLTLPEILPEVTKMETSVYQGGPVQPETLHFVHQYPDLIDDGVEIAEGIFWGGNFETLKIRLENDDLDKEKIKFFLGYSGWGFAQLNQEMEEDSWLTVKANKRLTFEVSGKDVWKESLNELGGKYKELINYPLDPQLN